MSHVAVLGTGLLGAGFVENLLSRGERVVVWNRTAEKTSPLVEKGATAAETPADAVRGASRVHLVLAEDTAVDAVLAAALPGLGDGVFVVDHSTNAPAGVAARHARLRAQGVRYVHAPVFMAPANARDATGLMLLAATDTEAAALEPVLGTMTGKVWHVGARPDLAAVHKLSGNGMLVGLAGVLGDLFVLGARHGLEPDQVVALFDVFKAGHAIAGIGKRVARGADQPASFELSMARKDVRLMVEGAGGDDGLAVLPAIATAMDRALDRGLGDRDFVVFAASTPRD